MPMFSRSRKGRDVSGGSVNAPTVAIVEDERPSFAPSVEKEEEEPKDPWLRNEVMAEDVQELLHVCTQEMKSRALDMPLLLLPFRPLQADTNSARSFIRNYFQASVAARYGAHGHSLYSDLKLVEPMALCSIMKWCWSRLKGGVVTWNTYELFKIGERKSHMAKHAFDTFIPLSVDSPARHRIIFDFFDLLAAIAANSQTNGLGGRKLSRLAGWWAFDSGEHPTDFQDGYRQWTRAADATCHLFFAYLRSLAPDSKVNSTISHLPRYLQKIVAETEYPPAMSSVLESATSKIVLLVDAFSPTPLASLHRAKRLEYRNGDPGLQRLCLYEDPGKLLTTECRRVLECMSGNSIPEPSEVDTTTAVPSEASWSRFEDIGFAGIAKSTATTTKTTSPSPGRKRRSKRVSMMQGPPPSWSDFLVTGFADTGRLKDAAALTFPPEQILPPLRTSRDSLLSNPKTVLVDKELKPGEVSEVDHMDLDETFWWVWMASLAAEEPVQRKATFSQCLVIETEMRGRRWLVLEEKLRPISPPTPEPVEEEPIVIDKRNEKRNKFAFGKRSRTVSGRILEEPTPLPEEVEVPIEENKPSTGPDLEQQARIQAAAAALIQDKMDQELARTLRRRGRKDDDAQSRTSSVLTVEPRLAREAGPALQWARKFDKEIIRARYLGDAYAGRGSQLREMSPNIGSVGGPGNHPRVVPKYELNHRALPPLPRRSMLSMNMDALSLAAPTPPPGSRTVHQQESQPLVTNFSPLSQQSGTSKSLVPSPLVPRKKTLGGDEDSVGTRRVHTDPLAAQSAANALDDPFSTEQQTGGDVDNVENSDQPENSSTSPTTSPKLKKGKHGSVRGLRKLFGKRIASEPTHSIAARRALFESKQVQQEPVKAATKRSFLRRKITPVAPSTTETKEMQPDDNAPPVDEPVANQYPERQDSRRYPQDSMDEGEVRPTIMEATPAYFERSAQIIHNTIPREPDAISPTFSNFTQGQVEDEPKWNDSHILQRRMEELPMHINDFRHEHNPEMEPLPAPRPQRVSPPPFQTRTAAMLYSNATAPEPTTPKFKLPTRMGLDSDPELTADDGSSETISSEPHGQTWEGGNRWAQIRQNAVLRRASDDDEQSPGHKSNAGLAITSAGTTNDELDPDGEESIEARVARIKARVAELTGSSPVLPQSASYNKFVRA